MYTKLLLLADERLSDLRADTEVYSRLIELKLGAFTSSRLRSFSDGLMELSCCRSDLENMPDWTCWL